MFNVKDSSFVISRSNSVTLTKNRKNIILKGNLGYFSPSGEKILTFNTGDIKTEVYAYNNAGEMLYSNTYNETIVDICFGKHDNTLFALTGICRNNEFFFMGNLNNKSEVLKLSYKLKIKKRFPTDIPIENTLNISFFSNKKQLIIGAGIKGAIMTIKGCIVDTFETIHAGYTDTNKKYYSILHKYGDGSLIDIIGNNKQIHIEKKMNVEYLDHSTNLKLVSSLAVFQNWDINEEGNKIITLDHSNTISLFNSSGMYIRDLLTDKDIKFVFFINNNQIAIFKGDNNTILYKTIE